MDNQITRDVVEFRAMPRAGNKPPDLRTVGGRLRWARDHLARQENTSVSQADIAARCGWGDVGDKSSQTRVSNYESNVRTPKLEDFIAIAKATGTRAEWLAFGGPENSALAPPRRLSKRALAAAAIYDRAPPAIQKAVDQELAVLTTQEEEDDEPRPLRSRRAKARRAPEPER